jgi:hypothetical protein
MRCTVKMGVPLLLLAEACLSVESGESRAPAELLAIAPSSDVELDAEVRLRFSALVSGVEGAIVRSADGWRVPASAELAGESTLVLRPSERWPLGEYLRVDLKEVRDGEGRPVIAPDEVGFTTKGDALAPVLTLRSPPPGSPAPPNVRSLVVSISPPLESSARLSLTSRSGTVSVALAPTQERGAMIAELPAYAGPCVPLCPNERYTLSLENGSRALGEPLATLTTSSVADLTPPEVRLVAVDRAGGRIAISVAASEAIRAVGTLWPPEGTPVRLQGIPMPSVEQRLEADRLLAADLECVVAIESEDLAGNRSEPLIFTVITPKPITVRITEIVPTPLRDWGDSEASGERFDARPGGGAVTDADEWIEIVNLSPSSIDLQQSGLLLRVIDGTPSETGLVSAPVIYFGAGGDRRSWAPGEAIVVHPRGSMARTEVTIELLSGGEILDRVRLGALPEDDHAGGRPPDFDHESLARDLEGRWRWCAPSPGDPSPSSDCAEVR